MRQHIIYRFIGILLSFQALLGQEYSFSYNFVNYNINNGFPSSEVYYGLRDSKGFYWFATDKGASKFNGIGFENYTTQDNLPDNNVISLFEDHNKNIWFISANSVSYYDINNNTITPYRYNNKVLNSRLNSPITTAFVDSDNTVYLILKNQGYLTINSEGKIQEFNNLVVYDKLNGFYALNKGKYHAVYWKATPLPYHVFESISSSDNKEIFSSEKNIVIQTQDNALTIKNYSNLSSEEIITPSNINSVSVNKLSSSILISTDNGIIKYFLVPRKELLYLSGKKINYTLDASKRGLFVLSKDNGLYIIPSNNILSLYENGSHFSNPISQVFASESEIYFLKEYENEPLLYKDYQFDKLNKILDIEMLKKINSGTFENGIEVEVNPNYIFSNSPEKKKIHVLSFTYQDDIMYILSHEALYKIQNEKIEQINELNTILGQSNTICNFDGYIWVGTNVGLYRYQPTHKKLHQIKTIGNYHILNMVNYYNKKLVIGSQNHGLFIYNKKLIKNLNVENGGISNLINAILVNNYKVWIATGNGIAQLSESEDTFRVTDAYSYSDGLNSTDISSIALYHNDIFAGSKYGLNKITPFLKSKNYLKTYIKHLKVNDENIPISYQVQVPHKGILEIDLMLNSYNSQTPKTYYRIKELNAGYRETSNLSIIYESLNSGDYTLEYYSKDYIEKTPIYSLSINVASAWYAKWYSILIFILLIAAAIYFATRYYSKKIQSEYKKEQEINRYKLLAFNKQMSSHFISNSFNAINNFILKKDNVGGSRYLSKMSKLFRHSLLATEKNYIPFNQEFEAIQSYIELEKLRYNNSFTYEIIIDENVPVNRISVMPLILQTLVENAIWHGLLPSSKPDKKLILRVKNTNYRNLLKIEIEDNGVGIDLKQLQKEESKGIQLVKSILRTNSYTKPIVSENLITFENLTPMAEEKCTICTFYLPIIISI